MSITGIRKEIQTLKKEVATDYKTIEELLKVSDIRTLTDQELFRLLKYHDPNLTTLEDLTDEILVHRFQSISETNFLIRLRKD